VHWVHCGGRIQLYDDEDGEEEEEEEMMNID
jgi:hypothetical protein